MSTGVGVWAHQKYKCVILFQGCPTDPGFFWLEPEDVQAHEDLRRAAGVLLHVCHPAGGRLCQATGGTFHGLAA